MPIRNMDPNLINFYKIIIIILINIFLKLLEMFPIYILDIIVLKIDIK